MKKRTDRLITTYLEEEIDDPSNWTTVKERLTLAIRRPAPVKRGKTLGEEEPSA